MSAPLPAVARRTATCVFELARLACDPRRVGAGNGTALNRECLTRSYDHLAPRIDGDSRHRRGEDRNKGPHSLNPLGRCLAGRLRRELRVDWRRSVARANRLIRHSVTRLSARAWRRRSVPPRTAVPSREERNRGVNDPASRDERHPARVLGVVHATVPGVLRLRQSTRDVRYKSPCCAMNIASVLTHQNTRRARRRSSQRSTKSSSLLTMTACSLTPCCQTTASVAPCMPASNTCVAC